MRDWPHAPIHRLSGAGAYMVIAGTYRKAPLLDTDAKLTLVHDLLLTTADELGWELQAWAVLLNHYHFVAISPDDASTLRRLISKVHTLSSRDLNRLDGASGRRVWYQFWDSHITFERSYLARLNYVHNNPVHHGVVQAAASYAWCSAAWFERTADRAFQKTVASFKTNRLSVKDDF